MNDRELLELAAKAAGIDGVFVPFGQEDNMYHGEGIRAWPNHIRTYEGMIWNPLTDDGDALRLAVKCEIRLVFTGTPEGDYVHANDRFCEEYFGNDPYAATRRAIVRAAAEIGRSMK